MTDQFSIITTLVTGFGLALVFGWLAERFLKTPTLVGYIIAGVSVGLFPLLPNVDRVVTEQFAEIGVMLLMFGVGLHFSVADLVKVKGVAVTGAMLQMAASGRRHGRRAPCLGLGASQCDRLRHDALLCIDRRRDEGP